eukprot:4845476-Lingulodinium_polyedra.AAC.1
MAMAFFELVDLPPGQASVAGGQPRRRLRSRGAHGILDSALGRAVCRPRRLQRVAVPCRFNTAA